MDALAQATAKRIANATTLQQVVDIYAEVEHGAEPLSLDLLEMMSKTPHLCSILICFPTTLPFCLDHRTAPLIV